MSWEVVKLKSHRTFALRRLHSLAGVVPLGVFLAVHLLLNSFALDGAAAYNLIIAGMNRVPYLFVFELIIIFLPLGYHGIYGLWITWTAKTNVFQYSYYRNWMYYGQRAAGIITFVFVTFHVYALRFPYLLGQTVSFAMMTILVRNPWMLAFYVIGIVATTYHFANGIFTFCLTWGITIGEKSRRAANMAVWVVFVALTAYAINTLMAFR